MEKPDDLACRPLVGVLMRALTRDDLLRIEEALLVGVQRADLEASGRDEGHLLSVRGQLRHFHQNELFHQALVMSGAQPSPLRGASLVVGGKAGVTIARMSAKDGPWIRSGHQSKLRTQLARINQHAQQLLQPDLFETETREPSSMTAFFVTVCGAEGVRIELAVPDPAMKGWLFREPVGEFVMRYAQTSAQGQTDLAKPTLKRQVLRRDKDGTTG